MKILQINLVLLFAYVISVNVSIADDDILELPKSMMERVSELLDSVREVNSTIFEKVAKYGEIIQLSTDAVLKTVSFIKTLLPGAEKDSEELKFLKQQFAIVNTKLDALDHSFQEIKNLIDWNSMRTNVIQYELSIKAVEVQFQLYLKAPGEAKPTYEYLFKRAYNNELQDAPMKLYLLLATESGGSFQDNMFKILRKQLKNNIVEIAQVTGFILRLIERGLRLEYAYLALIKDQRRAEEMKKSWKKRFDNLKKYASKVDKAIMESWNEQSKIDADAYAVSNAQLSNDDMARNIHKFLSKKFTWRKFFVLVYTFTDNNDKDRYFDNCDGFVKVNVGNKVIIVNSVDSKSHGPKINLRDFHSIIKSFYSFLDPKVQVAKELYQKVTSSCEFYKFRGVFEEKANIKIFGPSNHYGVKRVMVERLFHLKFKPYRLYVFA